MDRQGGAKCMAEPRKRPCSTTQLDDSQPVIQLVIDRSQGREQVRSGLLPVTIPVVYRKTFLMVKAGHP